MEGGRVNRSWYIGVVSDRYGGLGVGMEGSDGWYASGTEPGGLVI